MNTSYAKITRSVVLAGACMVVSVGQAQAGAFGLNEYGAVGTGMAGAGLGTSELGLGSIEFNPAALTRFKGAQTSSTFTYIGPRVRIEAPTGDTGNVTQSGRLVPAAQAGHQIDDRLWVGVSVAAPFGLVTSIDPNNWASYHGRISKVIDIDTTPSVAYKVNDWLSIGAGLQINYMEVELGSSITPLVPRSGLSLTGKDLSLGYKLGVTLNPMTGTEIGIGYRSELAPKLDGSLWNNIPITGASGLIPPGTQDMNLGLKLPAQLNVGLRQTVTPDLKLLLSYQWTNWSTFDRFMVETNAGPAFPLSFGFRDGWLVAAGGEYDWSPSTTLRAGINYERSPIYTAVREPRLPDADRLAVAVGASYKYSANLSVDAGLMHVFLDDGPIDIKSPGSVPFAGTAKSQVNIAAITVNYRW